MSFNQWTKDTISTQDEVRSLKARCDKATKFREDNKDIPKIAEILIGFGIEREEFKQELLKILNS